MVRLELTDYEAHCAIAHLTKHKVDTEIALQKVGHLLSKRDQAEVQGDISQINNLCQKLREALPEAVKPK